MLRLSSPACMLCGLKVCAACLGADHPGAECAAEDVQNSVFVLSKTKSCPNCAALIEKQSGCDQMMCTKCHCVFSWSTLEIQTSGAIHNPYFYQLDAEARARVEAALGRAQPVCADVQVTSLSRKVENFLETFPALQAQLEGCTDYMAHVRRRYRCLIDEMRRARASSAPGARDLELAWRWPRLQLLLGHRIRKGQELPSPYAQKDYMKDMRRIDTAHSKRYNKLDARITFYDTVPLLAAGAVEAESSQTAQELPCGNAQRKTTPHCARTSATRSTRARANLSQKNRTGRKRALLIGASGAGGHGLRLRGLEGGCSVHDNAPVFHGPPSCRDRLRRQVRDSQPAASRAPRVRNILHIVFLFFHRLTRPKFDAGAAAGLNGVSGGLSNVVCDLHI